MPSSAQQSRLFSISITYIICSYIPLGFQKFLQVRVLIQDISVPETVLPANEGTQDTSSLSRLPITRNGGQFLEVHFCSEDGTCRGWQDGSLGQGASP